MQLPSKCTSPRPQTDREISWMRDKLGGGETVFYVPAGAEIQISLTHLLQKGGLPSFMVEGHEMKAVEEKTNQAQ